jgi:tetratricopeptide (TPR) repeat protein
MDPTMKEQNTIEVRQAPPAEIRDGHALLHLARGWLKQGNPVVAIELLNSALGSREAEEDPELQAQILKETGRAWMMQSHWDTALSYYVSAQRVFLDHKHYRGAAECARNRANVCFQRGEYSQCEELCEAALKWCEMLKDHELRATILNTLAAVKSATGDLTGSISTFRLCLADFQVANNKTRQGYVLLNIGLSQTELGKYSEAVQSLNESLAIALDERDLHLVEICYQNIAKCHLAQESTIMARAVIDSARRMLPALNSTSLEAELNFLDGKVRRAMGDLEGARHFLMKTYQSAANLELAPLQADVLLELGLLYQDIGWHDRAVSSLEAAERQYRQLNIEKGICGAAEALRNLKLEKAIA